MKRLIKKANEIFKYETVSPIYITHVDSMDEIDGYFLHTMDEFCGAVMEAVQNDDTDLLEYFYYDFKDIINKMQITVGYDCKCHVLIETTRQLTSDEEEIVLNYITGQFSDGWGEGFEQGEVATYREQREEEVYDEEEGEYYYDRYTEDVNVYAHFWRHNKWDIKLNRI